MDMTAHVRGERVYALLDGVLSGKTDGSLQSVRKGTYVGDEVDGITPLLRLEPWKGATYSLSWGVSLAYVPNKLMMPLSFHRTPKSARFDLWEDGRSVAEREGGDSSNALIATFCSEPEVREQLVGAWRWTRPRAHAWWQQASTLDGVLALARDQVTRRPYVLDSLHSPPPELIVILTLARLGRVSEAEEELARIGSPFVGERDEIEEAIARAAAVLTLARARARSGRRRPGPRR